MRTIRFAAWLLALGVAVSARADMGELTVQAANLINAAEVAELIAKAGTDEQGNPRIREVPSLQVVYACGEDCAPGEATRLLIESAYRESARKAGLGIAQGVTARLTITRFYERNAWVRGFLGFMAGADTLRGELVLNEQAWKVGDASLSKFSGIDAVARAVGAESFKRLLTDASARASHTSSLAAGQKPGLPGAGNAP